MFWLQSSGISQPVPDGVQAGGVGPAPEAPAPEAPRPAQAVGDPPSSAVHHLPPHRDGGVPVRDPRRGGNKQTNKQTNDAFFSVVQVVLNI